MPLPTCEPWPILDAFCALAPTAAPTGDLPALSGQARQSAVRLGTVITQLRELEKELTLSQLFDAIVDRTGYSTAFNHENEEDMERWANVLELRSDLEDFDALAPGEALAAYLDQVQLVSDADTMKDGEQGQVTMITLHSAKGLEFPVVFIAGVEEGLLPIYRAIENEYNDPTAIEEERRLFYVAMTRAEHELVIVTDSMTPSDFISRLHGDGYLPLSAWPPAEQEPANSARLLTIRVFNGYSVTKLLSEGGFKFKANSERKYWARVVPAEEHSLDRLRAEPWLTDHVRVEVVDHNGVVLERLSARSIDWDDT